MSKTGSYWKTIPDALIDWVEKTRAPERYYRIIAILLRNSNWGSGVYRDGVKVERGQARITLHKLSEKTGYSLAAIRRLLKQLQKNGWVKIQSQNNLTIISLVWITEPAHLLKLNRNTFPKKAKHKAEHQKPCTPILLSGQEAHKAEHHSKGTGAPLEAQPELRNKRSIETKEEEIKEGGDKITSPTENSESKILEKKKDKEFIEAKLKEKDERLKEAVSHITNTFKNEYKKHFNKFPLVDRRSQERILESLRLSANSPDELKGITDTIVERIPDFFHLKDDWVKKKGHSFYAFSWRIDSLLSASIPVYATSHKDRGKYEMKEYVPW